MGYLFYSRGTGKILGFLSLRLWLSQNFPHNMDKIRKLYPPLSGKSCALIDLILILSPKD